MSKKKEKISKVTLFQIKNKALQLRKNYQLPFYLTTLICNLTTSVYVDYVRALLNLTEEFLRVKKYYKKHPEYEAVTKEACIKYLTSLGF